MKRLDLHSSVVARFADRRIAVLARTDPAMALLATAPSIGPITASAVVAAVDEIARFASGLVEL